MSKIKYNILSKDKKIFNTKNLIIMSLMVAINIILTRFLSFMIGNSIRISLGNIPIILSGIIIGPTAGALTGIASDLLGFFIRAHGIYFPGFTLSAALIGVIPGLVFYKDNSKNQIKKLLFSIITVEVLTSLVFNTLWLKILYGKAFLALLPSRLVTRIIIGPIEFLVIKSFFRYQENRETK
ncbi:folate family ECF transporter S component [Halanaerobaculum tunisiense]